MKQKIRKLTSLMLALIMVIGLISTAAISVSAENVKIAKVELSGVKAPVAGENSEDDSYQAITLPSDANYTVHHISWYDKDGDDAEYFQSGESYEASIVIEPKTVGYSLTSSTTVTYNGVEVDSENTWVDNNEGRLYVYLEFTVPGSVAAAISSVEISDVKVPVAEESAADASYQAVTLPSAADYKLYKIIWHDKDGNAVSTFKSSTKYFADVVLEPISDEYKFTKSTTVKNDGVDVESGNITLGEQRRIIITLEFIVSPYATASNVTISGKVGDAITVDYYSVAIDLKDLTWSKRIEVGEDLSSWFTNLPDGLTAKTRSSFATGEKRVVIYFNGTPTEICCEPIAITIPADMLSTGKDITVIENENAKFDFYKLINEAHVSGVKAPVAGERWDVAENGYLTASIPEDVNYTVSSIQWYLDGNSIPNNTFCEGVTYSCRVSLAAADGYKFASSYPATFNGDDVVGSENFRRWSGGRLVAILKEFTVEGVETEYNITVQNGSAYSVYNIYERNEETRLTKASYGRTIYLTADDAPEGKEFDKWEVVSGNTTIDDDDKKYAQFAMPEGDVEVKATYKDKAAVKYAITVTDGKATDSEGTQIAEAANGTAVTITANDAPEGKEFDKWEVVSGDVTLADVNSAATTFTMGEKAVEVKATYKDKAAVKYAITVTDGKATDSEGTQIVEAANGTAVTITANDAPEGKEFDKWEVVSGDITLADVNSAATTFTMGEKAVEVKATYKDISLTEVNQAEITLYGYTLGANALYFKINSNTEGITVKKDGILTDPDGANFTGELAADTDYWLKVKLLPESGYSIAGLKKENIKLSDGTVAERLDIVSDGCFAYFKLPKISATPTIITKVDITDIAQPKAGDPCPDLYDFTAKVPGDANYRIYYVTWFYLQDEDYNSVLNFEEGKTYFCEVILFPLTDCVFPDVEDIEITINGNSPYEVFSYLDGAIGVMTKFTVGEAITENEIAAANVTVTAPVKGALPENAATEDTEYVIADTVWEPADSPFKAGTEYTVTVTLKAKEGNKFTADTEYKINGESATVVSDSADEVKLSYKFAKTAEDTPTPPVTFKYGDANGDDKITAADVLLIRKHIAGQGVALNTDAADVNGDGKITAADVLLIRKFIAGQNVTLGK